MTGVQTCALPISPFVAGVLIDPERVRKCNISGPRYASYPTADRFVEAYDARAHQITLRQRNNSPQPGASIQPLSLYVHIPFCNTLEALKREGLIALEPEWITVTPRGRWLVRRVARVFDKHLSRDEQRERFSNVI